jgi:hypothetical protein
MITKIMLQIHDSSINFSPRISRQEKSFKKGQKIQKKNQEKNRSHYKPLFKKSLSNQEKKIVSQNDLTRKAAKKKIKTKLVNLKINITRKSRKIFPKMVKTQHSKNIIKFPSHTCENENSILRSYLQRIFFLV